MKCDNILLEQMIFRRHIYECCVNLIFFIVFAQFVLVCVRVQFINDGTSLNTHTLVIWTDTIQFNKTNVNVQFALQMSNSVDDIKYLFESVDLIQNISHQKIIFIPSVRVNLLSVFHTPHSEYIQIRTKKQRFWHFVDLQPVSEYFFFFIVSSLSFQVDFGVLSMCFH